MTIFQYYTYKKGSLSVNRFFWLAARFFWHLEQADRFNNIRRKSPQNRLFSLPSTFLQRSDEKKRVGQAAYQSNWRGINDVMWELRKKREKRIFLAGKSASWATRAQARIARASSHRALRLSLVRHERSRGRKDLIEFLLINCLRGATIIATHELSHYRNCGSN